MLAAMVERGMTPRIGCYHRWMRLILVHGEAQFLAKRLGLRSIDLSRYEL